MNWPSLPLRSLRLRVTVVVLVVLLAPLFYVWLSTLVDAGFRQRQRDQVRQSVRDTVLLLAAPSARLGNDDALAPQLSGVAKSHQVWLRVVGANSDLVASANHDSSDDFGQWLAGWFFGPDGAPSLDAYDAGQPPLSTRPEAIEALTDSEPAVSCRRSNDNKLWVCAAAMRVTTAQGELLVHAAQSSRRAIRALYDVRYQLLKLFLFVLPVAIVVGVWLGWSLVRPIQRLRREVLEQAVHAVPYARLGRALGKNRTSEITDLAEAFNVLMATLAARAQANEAFLADLAHELKNPVAAVRAAGETLMAGQDVPAERAERLSRALLQSSRRLDALVTELLDLARAEAGLPNEAREAVLLCAITRAVVEGYEASHLDDELKVVFRIDTPTEPALVRGVATRLETAVRNLVDNAASFAAQGAAGRVDVTVSRAPGWVTLTVRDNGPGIAPEHQHRVFERFFTTRGERRGTGLGLAMTKAIVEAHGGMIQVVSQQGAGAEFTVRLPVSAESHGL